MENLLMLMVLMSSPASDAGPVSGVGSVVAKTDVRVVPVRERRRIEQGLRTSLPEQERMASLKARRH